MILITILLLITLFDFISTDYNLKRGATEQLYLRKKYSNEHRLTLEMVLYRSVLVLIVIGIYFTFKILGYDHSEYLLIFNIVYYAYKMAKGNLIVMIKLWNEPIIYKRRK